MSTPTMNHMHQQQHQQQQQEINEIHHANLNSANSPSTKLTRSDSTSTVILEEEETRTCRRKGQPTHPPTGWTNLSSQLRSLLKTSGLFNNDWESSDKLNELFAASGDGFTLQKLLSEAGATDANINMNELMKLDSTKLLDSRTLSEFLRSESFDQLIASAVNNTDNSTNPPAIACSSTSFPELQSNQMKMDIDNPLYSFDITTSTPVSQQSMYARETLNAIDHDHAFLPKQTNKRTQERGSRRVSNRIQSRAVTSTPSEIDSAKTKRSRNVNRANDVETPSDLSYYLERRRKNNEASKVSRAARKQKYGDMDERCDEYERVNAELHSKITILETVTASLKSGLVNNFQRKGGD